VPSPLKKIQEQFVSDGTICNLKLTNAFMAEPYEEGYPHTLGIEAVIMDGEYTGIPVTDYLNIQDSTKNKGELYISKNGKLGRTVRNSLSVQEYNALADRLGEVEATREAWLPIIAEALTDAENPVFRGTVVQNEPADETNLRNKLSKDPKDINPYIDPAVDKEINAAREKVQGSKNGKKTKKTAEPDLSTEDQRLMEEAIGS
jgi:hypothetical protein